MDWCYEGVGWRSYATNGVPLYRKYNPYAQTETHNYTTSLAENDDLVSVGWRAEGVQLSQWRLSREQRALAD
ncbi:hypothetical protein [Olsenella sp. SW781]|uniref:hypothetical protein n=1 Tax=Olsenella sp. SW781 TaxID=2530046 RepID=UPI00336BEDB9